MVILSIETSCDDTCVSVLKIRNSKHEIQNKFQLLNFQILSNVVSSQTKLHARYGGVYPFLAKREHGRNLPIVLKKALKESKLLKISNFQFLISKQILKSKFQTLNSILKRESNLFKQILLFLKKYQKPDIDAIAVTIGPGLEPCLWTGVNFAKALAYWWDLPIIPVNHIEGHIFANFVGSKSKTKNQKSKIQIKNKEIEFPAICLVASGGHTQLILMKDFGKYKIIGETRDDAAGECFDKTARTLGLGYPGGPAIFVMAAKIRNPKSEIHLPKPMLSQKNYDFSFSGLKTAVLYHFKNQSEKTRKSKKYIRTMAFEIQQAIVDVLIGKTLRAVKEYKAKTLILGGGVIANKELQKQFRQKIEKEMPILNYLIPSPQYCVDNAAMIGIVAYCRCLKKEIKNWKDIKVDVNFSISKIKDPKINLSFIGYRLVDK